MKRLMRSLLLAAILSALLCVGALAAESEPVKGGIYDIKSTGIGATLMPKDASDKEIASGSSDGVATDGYYANAVKFDVTASELKEGQQYLLLVLKGEGVPTAENIAYIDQAAAQNGSVSFTAYPKELAKGTYHVYLVGAGMKFAESKVASFKCDQKYTLGDVDGDAGITANDALCALMMSVDKAPAGSDGWTDIQRLAADVDGVAGVSANDALWILEASVDKRVLN